MTRLYFSSVQISIQRQRYDKSICLAPEIDSNIVQSSKKFWCNTLQALFMILFPQIKFTENC